MQNGLVIATPDKHFPYVHWPAWELTLEVIDYANPAEVIDLGDFGDNRAFSRHGRKFGEKFDPDADMAVVIEQAQRQEKAARGRLTMLLGNHDDWIRRYTAENAPAIEPHLKTIGEIYGVSKEPRAYQDTYRIGKVGYVHDLGPYGENAIRATLQVAGHNVVFGHAHRLGTAYAGNDAGDRHFAMCCGWTGDRDKITYMPRSATRNWQLGFGAVRYVDGLAFASAVPIIEAERKVGHRMRKSVSCYFGGKKFTG